MRSYNCFNYRKLVNLKKAMVCFVLYCIPALILFMASVNGESLKSFELKLGPMADYGASPWYTEDIAVGETPLKFSPDSGANFIWATSDLCNTGACNAHSKVDTSQPGFIWINTKPTVRSFGPWGSMKTETGMISFNSSKVADVIEPFFASTDYTGAQFKYLAWDGGIGFPSNSDGVHEGSGFYMASLFESGDIKEPTFSVVTHPNTKKGAFYLGGADPDQYIPESSIELQPNTDGIVDYLWGTDLYSLFLGAKQIDSLTNGRFYLDTGSSLFKGDGAYVAPILEQLYLMRDKSGARIFEKVYDDCKWVCLKYIKGGPKDYEGLLPDFIITIGQTFAGEQGKSAKITLSPEQYSYLVEEGDRAGSWVPAFTVLDGVGGLLVGSTFMDYFYTTFNYVDKGNGRLAQGNMYLYRKSSGEGPKDMTAVPTPDNQLKPL